MTNGQCINYTFGTFFNLFIIITILLLQYLFIIHYYYNILIYTYKHLLMLNIT